MLRRILAATLAAIFVIGMSPVVFAQGVIAGRAGEARRPYDDYVVQLVDLRTNQMIADTQLDAQGRFSFTNVPVDAQYLLQLYSGREDKVVCTEGPYPLISPDAITKTNVNIKCGKPPAALWLLGGAALVGVTALAVQSGSQ